MTDEPMKMFEGLNPPYRTIVADPPWPVVASIGAFGRRANVTPKPYSTLSLEDIMAMPVTELADDPCVLFLWTTPRLNREGVGVATARAWGFRITGEFVWDKPNIGMGTVPRVSHEILLVCSRGVGALVDAPRDIHSVQRWPQPYGRGKTHSAKPPAAGDLIESISPGPYVELFARQPRLGWDAWGHGYEIGEAS